MLLTSMREGDAVIARNMVDVYRVTSVHGDSCTAKHERRPGRTRTFRGEDLEEVDDGVWQQMEAPR